MFAPANISASSVAIFAALTVTQSFLSLSVHFGIDNLFSMMVWSSSVILFSQVFYTVVTSIQYCRYLLSSACPRRNNTTRSTSVQKKWLDFFCGIQHFHYLVEAKNLRLDRGGFWRMCYPVAMGFFVLFVCIPGYDASCTCTLCAGFMFRSAHEEFLRGIQYHRPLSRRLLLTIVFLFGALSITLLFALSYATGLIVTNRGLQASQEIMNHESKFIFATMMAENKTNSSNDTDAWADSKIIENFILNSEISNPDVVQYLQWTVHSYPRKMSLIWLLFFMGPFMLANIPNNAPTLLVFEAAQSSTSFIAAFTLCCVSVVLGRQPFVLLRSSNSSSLAYLILSPALTWLIIKKLVQFQRQNVLYIPVTVIVVVTFVKHCIQHRSIADERFFRDLCIVSAVMITGYIAAVFLFFRLEHAAVRGGWGSSRQTHFELNEHEEGEGGEEDEKKFSIAEDVNVILHEAKRDMKLAESIVKATMDDDEYLDSPVAGTQHTDTASKIKNEDV